MGSLEKEGRARNPKVGLHTLSPGMIITDLLLSGATVGNKVLGPASRSSLKQLKQAQFPSCWVTCTFEEG